MAVLCSVCRGTAGSRITVGHSFSRGLPLFTIQRFTRQSSGIPVLRGPTGSPGCASQGLFGPSCSFGFRIKRSLRPFAQDNETFLHLAGSCGLLKEAILQPRVFHPLFQQRLLLPSASSSICVENQRQKIGGLRCMTWSIGGPTRPSNGHGSRQITSCLRASTSSRVSFFIYNGSLELHGRRTLTPPAV